MIDNHAIIPLTDGAKLSARIWFPEKPGAYPAILEYHPYPKRYITSERDEIGHGYFVSQNYISIRVDMRGSGDSEGFLSDEYTHQARLDAVEVINWIAEQSWCSGNVGMYGLSWGGFNGIQLATIAPPALKAVALAGASDDRYINDTHFKGGVTASEHFGWAATLLSFLTRPPDPEIIGTGWKELWLKRLDAIEWILPKWQQHPSRDKYWMEGFPCDEEAGLKIPTLIAAGTSDVYVNAALRMVKKQPDLVKAVIGPWGHHFPHRGIPGPAIDWTNQCVKWFDRWLKDQNNSVQDDPPIRIFVTEHFEPDGNSENERNGEWVSFNRPDIDDCEYLTFGLDRDNKLANNWDEGEIIIKTPVTMGTSAGEFMPMGWGTDLPTDQKDDDHQSVIFETDELDRNLRVIGKPALNLTLKSDRSKAFIVARLCDVAPDGTSTRISFAAHQISTEGGLKKHTPIDANKEYLIKLELDGIAHQFAKGHRIRISLSNTYWPLLWPSNQGDTLKLLTRDSNLQLPTPRDYVFYNGFKKGDGKDPHPVTILSKPIFERGIIKDNHTIYRISDASPRVRYEHGMETFGKTDRQYIVNENDPSKATMTSNREINFSRKNWHVSSLVEVKFYSDAEKITSDVSLVIKHNGEVIFERRYKSDDDRY